MSNSKKQDLLENDNILEFEDGESSDLSGLQQSSNSFCLSETICNSSCENEDRMLPDRLTESEVVDIDDDLVIAQSNGEEFMLHWLQALDLHFTGACRSDERLKPFLKVNVFCGIAEDRFVSHLNQNFDASEIVMLARCLCVPLVSVRVGKVLKDGTHLCPTSTRGNLNLSLLPSSELCLSFIGDDGITERLTTLSTTSQCAAMKIEGIPADASGLSFFLKLGDDETFYFWCCERSKLIGDGLLSQMRNLLLNKPSLAELTGISDVRLTSFAEQLRSCFPTYQSNILFHTLSGNPHPSHHISSPVPQSWSSCHSSGVHVPRPGSEGSPSPRPSLFKEGASVNVKSTISSVAGEKPRCCSDNHVSPKGSFSVDSSGDGDGREEMEKPFHMVCDSPSVPLLLVNPEIAVLTDIKSGNPFPLSSSMIYPQYCWCPSTSSPHIPPVSDMGVGLGMSLGLPTVPYPSTRLLMTVSPNDILSETLTSSADLPPLVPDPLFRLPIPACQQQFPTFTPLVCDPIVHIPIIEVCSSGQGYIVSSAPQLIPEMDSVMETEARETLRLLISGSSGGNSAPQLLSVLPSMMSRAEEKPSMLVMGSRGLYAGTHDVGALKKSELACMGLVSSSPQDICLCRTGEVDVCDYTDDYKHSTGTGGMDDTI